MQHSSCEIFQWRYQHFAFLDSGYILAFARVHQPILRIFDSARVTLLLALSFAFPTKTETPLLYLFSEHLSRTWEDFLYPFTARRELRLNASLTQLQQQTTCRLLARLTPRRE